MGTSAQRRSAHCPCALALGRAELRRTVAELSPGARSLLRHRHGRRALARARTENFSVGDEQKRRNKAGAVARGPWPVGYPDGWAGNPCDPGQ